MGWKPPAKRRYIVRFNYCGKDKCGITMEKGSVGEILGTGIGEKAQGKCIGCWNDAITIGYFSKRADSP